MTTSRRSTAVQDAKPLIDIDSALTRILVLDLERVAYLVIFVASVISRFWDLGARTMSHDESLHTRYSWSLYRGDGFTHTPLMHGPVLFHMVALSYLLFGDSDFTARIYPALLGILIVMFPIFLRRWLGKLGALSASLMLLMSPLMLYYSRYIREDIPALTGALIMVYAIWNHFEKREFKYLVWLSFGQFLLFASKEVSFIYIAIFGSFLTCFFVYRLLNSKWPTRGLFLAFGASLIVALLVLLGLVIVLVETGDLSAVISGTQTQAPLDPSAPLAGLSALPHPLSPVRQALLIGLAITLVTVVALILIGQWKNLRQYAEVDLMIVLGSLVFASLSPFLVHALGFDPLDETSQGIATTAWVTVPMLMFSVLVGLAWFMIPPTGKVEVVAVEVDSDKTTTAILPPDLLDWLQALVFNRWWAVGALYWGLFIFFYTTMFTNPNGIGTGLVASLGYWLAQQEVQRGGQPWYYYIYVMLPIYEFLPLTLVLVGAVGWFFRRVVRFVAARHLVQAAEVTDETQEYTARTFIDPSVPPAFPWQAFTAYWIVTNLVAYSVAGEKMPWLATHLTMPMILLGGWVLGGALSKVEWRKLRETGSWILAVVIPVAAVALLRVLAPLCQLAPANLLCNTVIPQSYSSSWGFEVSQLANLYAWIAALAVLAALVVFSVRFVLRVGASQTWRLAMVCLVGWLVFLTVRASWRAAYTDYNQATEYLVYAHASGAVKDVMAKVEELSLRTTDGYGIRVAYDNEVSWPMSWYFRDYYNAIFYNDQPSRGILGDSPIIIAGPSNWSKVESLIGDRYYRFEYIRMWWPMQDYFDMKTNGEQNFANFMSNPDLQRGVWNIFYDRDYTRYGVAVGKSFELSRWPLADRMRMYVRKDIFAQVWSYGVAASQTVETVDPYAQNIKPLKPDVVFGTGMLNRPHGMAIGPDNLLYVADSGNHRIMVFDQEGQFIRSIGKYGLVPAEEDGLNEPWDVAVDSDGTVVIADTWNHRIVEYSSNGQFLTSWGFQGPNVLTDPFAFWGPRGITIDKDGLIYLTDTGNKRIQVFDSDGIFEVQIGTGGSENGQVDEPAGIAISESTGQVYVADTWNTRIMVFRPDGTFAREWRIDGWFAQSNERPYIALDSNDNVYVTDPEAFRVIVFDSTGQFLYTFGDFESISLAGGIEISNQGYLFLTDTAANTVKRYHIENVSP